MLVTDLHLRIFKRPSPITTPKLPWLLINDGIKNKILTICLQDEGSFFQVYSVFTLYFIAQKTFIRFLFQQIIMVIQNIVFKFC